MPKITFIDGDDPNLYWFFDVDFLPRKDDIISFWDAPKFTRGMIKKTYRIAEVLHNVQARSNLEDLNRYEAVVTGELVDEMSEDE